MPIPVKLYKQPSVNVNSGGNPVEIPQGQLNRHKPFNTSTQVRIRNFVWANTPVKPGVTFLTSQGSRLVLEARQNRIIYLLVRSNTGGQNKVFMQPSNGFVNDVVMFPFEDAGRKLQTVKTLAEYEVQILIGVLSTTGWATFSIVMGVDVFQFFVNNKNNLPRWPTMLQALLQTNRDLKVYAPTLRSKLIQSTLLVALEGSEFAASNKGDISGKLAEAAIKDPKIAGRAMGIIAGKLGANILNGRLSVLSAVWAVLLTVATKAAASIPGAVGLATNEVAALGVADKAAFSNELLNLVKRADIKLSQADAEKIIEEVARHPKEIKGSLVQLAEAFKSE